MYKICHDGFITFLLIFIFLFTLHLIFIINFPQEVFAMEPNVVVDHYGDSEYVGPDPYGHFNNPTNINAASSVFPNTDTIHSTRIDSYGTTPSFEKD